MADPIDLEIDALGILDTATDYDSGIDALKGLYNDESPENAEASNKLIASYGDKLFYKFKQKPYEFEDLAEVAPIKPNEVTGETEIEKINNWEEANVAYLNETPDLDYVASRDNLTRQVQSFASEARRDIRSDSGDGLWGEVVDKDFRLLQGALGPIASAFGNDELGTFLGEYTNRENDSTLASAIATGAGSLIPMLIAEVATGGAATAGIVPATAAGMGSTATLVTQTVGATRAAYNRYLKETGDTERAEAGAALELAGQAVGAIPLARGAGKLLQAGKATATAAGVKSGLAVMQTMGLLKTTALTAAEGAFGGTAGQVLSNVGASIGTDQPLDIGKDLMNQALSNAILAGSLGGVYALNHDIAVNNFNRILKQAHKEVNTPPPDEGGGGGEGGDPVDRPEAEQKMYEFKNQEKANDMYPFEQDEDGHFVLQDVTPDLFEKRVEETADIYDELDDVITGEEIDPLLYPTDEAGEGINMAVQPDVTQSLEDYLGISPEEVVTDEVTDEEIINHPTLRKDKRVLAGGKTVWDVHEDLRSAENGIARWGKMLENPNLPDDARAGIEGNIKNLTEVRQQALDKLRPLLQDAKKQQREVAEALADFRSTSPEEVKPSKNLSLGGRIIVSDVPNAIKPNRFTTYLANKILGSDVSLQRNVVDGAYGAYYPKTNDIKLLRSMGADPHLLTETIAHEVGHLVDGLSNNAFKSEGMKHIAQKLTGFKKVTNDIAKALRVQAKEISMQWRPGWDGSSDTPFGRYRSDHDELYADVFSAVVNAPDWVRKNFPDVMEALDAAMLRDPKIADTWRTFQEFENNPDAVSAFNFKLKRESRPKQGAIEKARLQAQAKSIGSQAKSHLDEAHKYVFDRYAAVRQVFNSLAAQGRTVGYDILNNITRKDYVSHFISRVIDRPIKSLMSKIKDAGIDFHDWAEFEWANRVINETTQTIENIKQNPEVYAKAAETLKAMFAQAKGVNPSMLIRAFSPEALSTPDGIIQAFASIDLIGDAAKVVTRADFEGKYPLDDPKRNDKINAAVRRAKAALAKRKVSIPVEQLRNMIKNLPEEFAEVKPILEEVTTPGAFAVRKYLVNPGGTTIFDAERDMQYLRRTLGPEKFKFLQEQSAKYHDILARALPVVEESQIFSPELLNRLHLNKGNYVTANQLKYFEGDNSINGSIRMAIGSLGDIGNELASTNIKTKALIERAYFQRAQNAAIYIAKQGGLVVEEIKPKYGESIFDTRTLLSTKDKDHSYMVGYEEGRPTLYKIKGKEFENMFNNIRDIPVIGGFLDLIGGFNNMFLTRQLKTALSPAFIVNQKRIDRKHEAMMAYGYGVTGFGTLSLRDTGRIAAKILGFPVHAQKALREIDAKTIAEIKHFKKTGELTGGLKKLIDLDGAALELYHGEIEGIADTLSSERALYEDFGEDFNIIPETHSMVGQFVQETKQAGDFVANKIANSKIARLFSDYASFDELRAKVNGFEIAKLAGMTDAQAAVVARERFGNPDPLGGGTAAPVISSMFLFGRAHFNGLHNVYRYANEFGMKSSAIQAAILMFPKIMGSAVVMGAAIRSIWGDDTAEKYEKMINMIPENEWITKNITPLGFQDPKGNIYNFFDVNNKDITPDWKAFYQREPQAHEFTAISRVLWPLFKELGKGDVSGAVSGVAKGTADTVAANVQPLVRYVEGLFTMITGGNPEDHFRNKPIISKDTMEAGSLLDKGAEYGKYVFSQQYGSLVPYNPFRTTEPKGILETVITKAPLTGPLTRAFIGITNYGNVEVDNAIEAKHAEETARIRLSVDDNTSSLLEQHTIARAQITSLGKGWQTKVGPEAAKHIKILTAWQTKVWTPYKNEMLLAKEAGDMERYNLMLNSLQKSSAQIKKLLLPKELQEAPAE